MSHFLITVLIFLRVNKNRVDEINEIIEKAQKNAQNIIAANPNITSYFEITNQIRT